MGLTLETSISFFTVFVQGILSFFSPCVLPLVPLYIGYLAGGAKSVTSDGKIIFSRSKVITNTLFFILGISFAFFVLGFGFTKLGQFFSGNRKLFAQIGGILVIFFGLYQLGIFGTGILGKEKRLPLNLNKLSMNPLTALVFGFTFSFAWTPCVGPALTGVLLMASSAETSSMGYLLIGVYTLGFVLPFLAVGLSAEKILRLFKQRQNLIRYTAKVGGVLLILMGIMMFTGILNQITGYLSGSSGSGNQTKTETLTETHSETEEVTSENETESASSESQSSPAYDFTLKDQYGEEHTLSKYKGKTVLLNFWATWCTYCIQEMPDLQNIYESLGKNEEDVIILGIAAPGTQDVSEEEISTFLKDKDITYPTIMNPTGDLFQIYGATGLPTTYMIDEKGNVFGYVSGMLSKEQFLDAIKQTQDSVK